jgi:hypothetical protein
MLMPAAFQPEQTVVEDMATELELPIIEVPCCYNCASCAQQNDGSHYCWFHEIDVSPDWYCLKHLPEAEFEEQESKKEEEEAC